MKGRFCVPGLLALFALVAPVRASGPGESVVKVYASVRGPDYLRPWNKQPASESVGSGVVIEGKQILTSAHVVLYASTIYVQGKDGGEKVEARVKCIGASYDLALLTVDDDSFFATRPALALDTSLPKERDSVEVFGYPLGGTNQSVTKGIVSRVDFVPSTYRSMLLRVQIDAALNPGNSGGPAVVDGKMIGIAFSRLSVGIGASIGYVIPSEEIAAFLTNPAPKPRLDFQFQPLQNETLRKKLGLDSKTQGILINHPSEPLQPYDVITHLGSHALDNQGQVKVAENLRFHFQYVVPQLVKDGKVPATVLRDGEVVQLDLPTTTGDDLVLPETHGEYPAFFLCGPLVFSPAARNTASQYLRMSGFDPTTPLLRREHDKVRFPSEQLVVVASPLLGHKCARGYSDPVGRVVEEVNGVKIKNLHHLVEVLRDCKDEYVTFVFAGERAELLVLKQADMTTATQEVMDDNSIPRRGTPELVELWNQKKQEK